MQPSVKDSNTPMWILNTPAFSCLPGESRDGITGLYGNPIPDDSDVLAKTFTFAKGADRNAKRWANVKASFEQVVTLLTKHVLDPKKDGRSIVPGELHKSQRIKREVVALDMIGIDVDSGEPIKETLARLEKMGCFVILHTTHSHMKDSTVVLQNSLAQFIKKEKLSNKEGDRLANVKSFLLKDRGYLPNIVADISVDDEWSMQDGGLGLVVRHVPMPKFRIFFPLENPFVIAKQAMSQDDALKRWGGIIKAVGDGLSLHFDTACLDASRLFYLPRHAQGAPFETHVIRGPLMRWEDIKPTDVASAKPNGTVPTVAASTDRFRAAGEAMGGSYSDSGSGAVGNAEYRFSKSGLDVWDWSKHHAKRLKLADLIKVCAPEKIRRDVDADKIEMECPFDAFHGNAGDPNDKAFFVTNAQNGHSESFTAYCGHNSCQEHNDSKTDYICQMINDGTITEADIKDPTYLLPSDEEVALDALVADIATLTKKTPGSEINKCLSGLAAFGENIAPVDRTDIIAKISKQTGLMPKEIEARLKPLAKVAKKAALTTERHNDNAATIKAGAAKNPTLVYDVDGFDHCALTAFNHLLKVSETEQMFFEMGGQKVVLDRDENNPAGVTIIPLGPDQMTAQLNHRIDWRQFKGDSMVSVACPTGFAKDMLYLPERRFTRLDRFSASPFFTRDGELVATPGYDEPSRVLYNPPRGFVVPEIPLAPTDDDVKAAVELIDDNVFQGFPFFDGEGRGGDSSKAHAWALLLLGYVREMIPGFSPLHFLNKPAPGTGATLLVESITRIAAGVPAAIQVEKESGGEQRKAMTSFLLSGAQYFFMDNINRDLKGSTIAAAVTSEYWTDRILGVSKDAHILVRATFICAGNNVALSKEVARRCLPIPLNAKRDPTRGRIFRHDDLPTWIEENRPELVAACLVIVQSWIQRGKPKWSGR